MCYTFSSVDLSSSSLYTESRYCLLKLLMGFFTFCRLGKIIFRSREARTTGGDTWKRQLFFVYLPGLGVDIGVRFRNRMNSKKHVDVNLETSLPYHKLSCTVALIQICRREYGIDSFWSE